MASNTLFLRAWRKHRDMSQEALESASGIDRTHISKLERGLGNYTKPTLEALAGALRLEVKDLFMEPGAGAEIIDIWDHIDPRDRPRALEMMRVFSRK